MRVFLSAKTTHTHKQTKQKQKKKKKKVTKHKPQHLVL